MEAVPAFLDIICQVLLFLACDTMINFESLLMDKTFKKEALNHKYIGIQLHCNFFTPKGDAVH